MAMLLGSKGNDILQWRASVDLLAKLKGRLARKWEQSAADDAQTFLEEVVATLRAELSYEQQLTHEITALDHGLAAAESPAAMLPLQARYLEVVAAHFSRRRSVLALCGLCNQLHDRLLARAVSCASDTMLRLGQGEAPPFALLVSGPRGRREQTLRGKNRYFLLHREATPGALQFKQQLASVLLELGLMSGEEMLWQGSAGQWDAFVSESFVQIEQGTIGQLFAALPPFAAPQRHGPRALPEWEWRLTALADLCLVHGDAALAAKAQTCAGQKLRDERNRDPFLQLARRVIGLPVALGRFGRWRLQSGGQHRGELNLEELALAPLIMALRVLALHLGIQVTGSVERVQRLLELGALDVELAGRLLKAYQCLMQLKILSEIRSEESGSFCNPEELSQEEQAGLRSSLEAVQSLQKIAYQRLVGQG